MQEVDESKMLQNVTGHTIDNLLETYEYMLRARTMDLIEQEFTARGEAFFHVSGEGHEGLAILAHHLKPSDWLHCHYRDKALMLALGITEKHFFLALFNKRDSESMGRQINAHMSAKDLNIVSLSGPVGNSALHAVGVAASIKDQDTQPIVLSTLGDGTTQEGEFMESLAHAVRDELPVLFIIQDNTLAISTTTSGRTFFSQPGGEADSFYGLPIIRIDGRYPQNYYTELGDIVEEMRTKRKPAIVIFSVDRLHHHTNADNQTVYRDEVDISTVRKDGDPLVNLQNFLIEQGMELSIFEEMQKNIRTELDVLVREAQVAAEPAATFTAFREVDSYITDPESENNGDGSQEITMLEAMRNTLEHWLESDERTFLYGQDIEDPKGDVFGITRGLSTKYKERVQNSPLSESLIVGTAIGRSLTGTRSVAFLQFSDFLPVAFNQIYADLGTMFWRSGGKWQCPVIIMSPCGGYSPGLGPFHAASMESIVSHVPGINVVMPSTAADAAGLMNACLASERPTIFFYPKVQLNNQETKTSKDITKHFTPLGRAKIVEEGSDISFITYGNGVALCQKAIPALQDCGVHPELIDIRSIVPWDQEAVLKSAEKTGKVIICSEDNKTSSFAGEIAAYIAEHASKTVEIRRITREDTYVPCNYANQLEVLPSYKRILETAVTLLSGNIEWKKKEKDSTDHTVIEAMGSSPSDESITVIEWKCKKNDTIQAGDLIAELEADKTSFDLRSPASGVIQDIMVEEGETVIVGTPMIQLESQDRKYVKPVTKEEPGNPIITGISTKQKSTAFHPSAAPLLENPGIVAVTGVKGERIVDNEEIALHIPDWNAKDITKRTGIESRTWIGPNQSALTMAVDAALKLFDEQNIALQDIDAIVCSTGTPMNLTPSMAASIHYELSKDLDEDCEMETYDISAACSGYLYGMKLIHNDLLLHPEKKVLFITTEVLSPKIKLDDAGTAPIFADAATASLLVGSAYKERHRAEIFSPMLSAQGAPTNYLYVPSQQDDYIKMDGRYVFVVAIKNMLKVLAQACEKAKIRVDQLDLLVPHQANQRILDMVRQKLHFTKDRVFSNIQWIGNTSSSTIPLCLETLFKQNHDNKLFGLVAFGGGFTYGSTVLRMKDSNNNSTVSIKSTEKQIHDKKFIQGALKRALDRIKKDK